MERIPFVGLHAHCGVGSPFDGFGYPEDHMNFAYSNGAEALALTDHGNMNGLAYQIMHAKKMKAEGKDFKPIFGVEAYFIPSVEEWKAQLEEYRKDKKLAKQIDNERSGTTIENEGASKSITKHDITRRRHLVLLAQPRLHFLVFDSELIKRQWRHQERHMYRERVAYRALTNDFLPV